MSKLRLNWKLTEIWLTKVKDKYPSFTKISLRIGTLNSSTKTRLSDDTGIQRVPLKSNVFPTDWVSSSTSQILRVLTDVCRTKWHCPNTIQTPVYYSGSWPGTPQVLDTPSITLWTRRVRRHLRDLSLVIRPTPRVLRLHCDCHRVVRAFSHVHDFRRTGTPPTRGR